MEEKCIMRHELFSKSVLCCVFPVESDIIVLKFKLGFSGISYVYSKFGKSRGNRL